MESYTEDPRSWILNQEVIEGILHRSILLDHKDIREGIQYHEKKELLTIYYEDGVESNLFHRRSKLTPNGVQTYTTNQKFVDEEVKDETIETNLAEDEIAAFKRDWKDNCQLPNVQFDGKFGWLPYIGKEWLANDPQASWKLSSRNF